MYRKSLNSKKKILAVCQNIEQLTVYIKILNKLSKNNCSFCVCCVCSTEGCFAMEKALNLYLGISCKINGVKEKTKTHSSTNSRLVVWSQWNSSAWWLWWSLSSPRGLGWCLWCCRVNLGTRIPSGASRAAALWCNSVISQAWPRCSLLGGDKLLTGGFKASKAEDQPCPVVELL